MAVQSRVEVDAMFRDEMLTIGLRDGFDRCYFDAATVERLVEKTGKTKEQVLMWARHMRFSHGTAKDMENALRMVHVENEVSIVSILRNCTYTASAYMTSFD